VCSLATFRPVKPLLIGMPTVVAGAMVELLRRIAGYAADVSPATEQLLGRTPRDFVQFASDYAAAFREVRTDHGASGRIPRCPIFK
jgi:hypothetical protein